MSLHSRLPPWEMWTCFRPLPFPHLPPHFFQFVLAYFWVAYRPNMLPRSRLCNSLTISKLFYFLYFIPTLKIPWFCVFHRVFGGLFSGGVLLLVYRVYCIYSRQVETQTPLTYIIAEISLLVSKQVNSRHLELYTLYHTIKTRVITSHIMYLSSHLKPAGGPLACSWYTLLRSQGVDRWVSWTINTNTYLHIEGTYMGVDGPDRPDIPIPTFIKPHLVWWWFSGCKICLCVSYDLILHLWNLQSYLECFWVCKSWYKNEYQACIVTSPLGLVGK